MPYGKYNYCQINRVKNLVFAYENKQDTRIVCLNGQGEELFYVFQYDNGPDKLREGLFRITDENGLIGFADSLGNIVIKPQSNLPSLLRMARQRLHFQEKVRSFLILKMKILLG